MNNNDLHHTTHGPALDDSYLNHHALHSTQCCKGCLDTKYDYEPALHDIRYLAHLWNMIVAVLQNTVTILPMIVTTLLITHDSPLTADYVYHATYIKLHIHFLCNKNDLKL